MGPKIDWVVESQPGATGQGSTGPPGNQSKFQPGHVEQPGEGQDNQPGNQTKPNIRKIDKAQAWFKRLVGMAWTDLLVASLGSLRVEAPTASQV